jgi:arylsulfatase A-like enzyme
MAASEGQGRPPNILLVITDQQRQPRHWPQDPGWLRELMPNEAELARTGLTFTSAFCNTAMCSPSRATLFTGRYPAEHGVTLTLTAADLHPDPRNAPAVTETMIRILRRHEAPVKRVLTQYARGALRLGPHSGNEPVLPPGMSNLATMLREAGYEVAYKGKWHLTHPSGDGTLLSGWDQRDATRIAADYGFADWEAPDAGENAKAENFGGGNAGHGRGWDEVYTSQAERWLGRTDLPEPFCLVVSLVNPHDVLGYPASCLRGGYAADEFRGLGVELPPTVDEDLGTKPGVQALTRMGMNAYLGPLGNRRAQRDYVNFYAYLHRVVDRKLGRLLAALGSADDPGSLRARTVVVRCADHGEMGLSHGGLRQKMFNTYEETINVPLVFSNPALFADAAETDALASLVDVVPTLLSLGGREANGDLRGRSWQRAQTPTPSWPSVRRSPSPTCSITPRRRPRSRMPSTSPTTITRRPQRCRMPPASRTGSARSGPATRSTRSTSTPRATSRRSTSSTTSSATRWRSRTCSACAPASRAQWRPGRFTPSSASASTRRWPSVAPHPGVSLSTRRRPATGRDSLGSWRFSNIGSGT